MLTRRSPARSMIAGVLGAIGVLVTLAACGSSASTTAKTEASSDSTAASDPGEVDTSSAVLLRPVLQCFVAPSATGGTAPAATTAVSFDATGSELLAAPDGQTCQVGPPAGDGTLFRPDAEAVITNGAWAVTVGLLSGAGGKGVWNELAARCFAGDATCPTHQLAIEVDGAIVSAPTVNAPEFSGTVQIAGTFSRAQAEAIAATLNQGAGG